MWRWKLGHYYLQPGNSCWKQGLKTQLGAERWSAFICVSSILGCSPTTAGLYYLSSASLGLWSLFPPQPLDFTSALPAAPPIRKPQCIAIKKRRRRKPQGPELSIARYNFLLFFSIMTLSEPLNSGVQWFLYSLTSQWEHTISHAGLLRLLREVVRKKKKKKAEILITNQLRFSSCFCHPEAL